MDGSAIQSLYDLIQEDVTAQSFKKIKSPKLTMGADVMEGQLSCSLLTDFLLNLNRFLRPVTHRQGRLHVPVA